MSRFAALCMLPAALIAFVPSPSEGAQNARLRPFIAGGTQADIKDFPYQVALDIRYGNDTYRCSGSIVDANWVLTAGHCFYHDGKLQPLTFVEIRYGDTRLDSPNIMVKRAIDVVVHPEYQHNSGRPLNDVALVRTDSRMEKKSIQLDDKSDLNGNAVVIGWGATQYRGDVSNVLMKITLPLVSNTTCNEAYDGKIGTGMLCAGSSVTPGGTCGGDSGGPLVQVRGNVPYQIGVTSWAPVACDTSTTYRVFTRVSSIRDWTDDVIKGKGGGPAFSNCFSPRFGVPINDCDEDPRDLGFSR